MPPPRLVIPRNWLLPPSTTLLLQHRYTRLLPRWLDQTSRITFSLRAELRYAAIEALAISWRLEQPLTKMFGDNTLDEISNTRLFRLKQWIFFWYFRTAYLPGKTNHAADATSRHPSPYTDVSMLLFEDYSESFIADSISRDAEQITTIPWSLLAQETSKDPVLSCLKCHI